MIPAWPTKRRVHLRRRQWRQLFALTLAHAVTDMYVGIVAPVLVPLRDHYGIPIRRLIAVSALFAFAANLFQIPIGQLRARWRSPLPICLGVLLAGVSVLLVALPTGPATLPMMAVIVLAAGLGVAIVHPEGLRAVHGLNQLPASLATAIFMVAGFLGFASGALISAWLTQQFGLRSLLWLCLAAPAASLPTLLTGTRLPVDATATARGPSLQQIETIPKLPFAPIFALAAILATCSHIQATLLPTHLHEEVGFSLAFSGLSFTLFGLGGAIGAVFWGAMAPRLGHLRILLFCTLAGAPLTLLYLLLAPRTTAAAALLALTGFIVYTGFPLCVTLARYAASNLRFGQRMGWISGGSWGLAAVALWGLGVVSERTGLGPLLHLVWGGYLLAALLLFHLNRS